MSLPLRVLFSQLSYRADAKISDKIWELVHFMMASAKETDAVEI